MLGCAALQRSLLGRAFLGSQPGLQDLLCPWQTQLGEALCFPCSGESPATTLGRHHLAPAHAARYHGLSADWQRSARAKHLSATGPDYIKTIFKEVKPENSLQRQSKTPGLLLSLLLSACATAFHNQSQHLQSSVFNIAASVHRHKPSHLGFTVTFALTSGDF